MKSTMRALWCLVFAALAGSCVSPVTEPPEPIALVIPSRYSVVRFAMDVGQMRDVAIIAYRSPSKPGSPVLHAWDGTAGRWNATSVKELSERTLFSTEPKHVVLVGYAGDLPAEVQQATGWCADVMVVPTLETMHLANALNKLLKFTPAEWKRLARDYGFGLQDRNAERRRYGKYGPPSVLRGPPYNIQKEPEPVPVKVGVEEEAKSAVSEPAAPRLGGSAESAAEQPPVASGTADQAVPEAPAPASRAVRKAPADK